ncbi:DKNYY domain-containing protein [uncultured Litoreibacter sp.]|uniref:DKNYY domain-containing protein n=1 Tax=uncultured Litoreibacter sp. TaxID=1392394 RepID=UPI00261AF5A7|nr:DKNYY domain-containing protein [uncultured Litoreibacter sp.]
MKGSGILAILALMLLGFLGSAPSGNPNEEVEQQGTITKSPPIPRYTDLSGYTHITGPYYRDKRETYAFVIGFDDYEKLIGLSYDPETLELLPGGFARDSKQFMYPHNYPYKEFYQSTDSADHDYPLIVPAEATESFQQVDEFFYMSSEYVFLTPLPKDGTLRPMQVIEGADPATFEVVVSTGEEFLSKDANTVFYQADAIAGIDPDSLRTFDFSTQILADARSVYINGIKSPNIEASSFKIHSVDEENVTAFASDRNNRYTIKRPYGWLSNIVSIETTAAR